MWFLKTAASGATRAQGPRIAPLARHRHCCARTKPEMRGTTHEGDAGGDRVGAVRRAGEEGAGGAGGKRRPVDLSRRDRAARVCRARRRDRDAPAAPFAYTSKAVRDWRSIPSACADRWSARVSVGFRRRYRFAPVPGRGAWPHSGKRGTCRAASLAGRACTRYRGSSGRVRVLSRSGLSDDSGSAWLNTSQRDIKSKQMLRAAHVMNA